MNFFKNRDGGGEGEGAGSCREAAEGRGARATNTAVLTHRQNGPVYVLETWSSLRQSGVQSSCHSLRASVMDQTVCLNPR